MGPSASSRPELPNPPIPPMEADPDGRAEDLGPAQKALIGLTFAVFFGLILFVILGLVRAAKFPWLG